MKTSDGKRRITAHERAVMNPATRQMIKELRRCWASWDHVRRGEQVKRLLGSGCSLRGLARDIGKVSQATLKNYADLASFSSDERDALRRGATEKRALSRKRALERDKARLDRIEEERSTGRLSDELADTILALIDLVNPGSNPGVRAHNVSVILAGVRMKVRGQAGDGPPPPIRLPRNVAREDLFDRTRPADEPQEFFLGHLERWLANVVMSVAPEFVIRETGMNKAEKRASEKPRTK